MWKSITKITKTLTWSELQAVCCIYENEETTIVSRSTEVTYGNTVSRSRRYRKWCGKRNITQNARRIFFSDRGTVRRWCHYKRQHGNNRGTDCKQNECRFISC